MADTVRIPLAGVQVVGGDPRVQVDLAGVQVVWSQPVVRTEVAGLHVVGADPAVDVPLAGLQIVCRDVIPRGGGPTAFRQRLDLPSHQLQCWWLT